MADDHFSRQAATYRRFRPNYPPDFLAWVAGLAGGRRRAWDVGTGNGQAAEGLADHFELVVASDLSLRQLAQAEPSDRIRYVQATAESAPLATASLDLVTVAQALHWFEFAAFWTETRRVLRPDGAVVAWCYERAEISPEIDPPLVRFHDETMGPFWPARRSHVIAGYRTIEFPFVEIATPSWRLTADWSLDHLLGYVASWSAVERFRRTTDRDPLPALDADLSAVWGERARVRRVNWPLTVLAGRP